MVWGVEVADMDRRRTGALGEDLAVAHLERQGYRVIDRNWRSGRCGEVDVVAIDPDPPPQGTIVFCEVKCRRGTGYGDPLEAVTEVKLRRLNGLACEWLRSHNLGWFDHVRLDAVGVLLLPGQDPVVKHRRGVTL